MTKLAMPKIDRKIFQKKEFITSSLKKIINPQNVLDHEDEIRPFETDALSAYKQKPLVVVFPENTNEVSKILTYCNRERIKVVPRGFSFWTTFNFEAYIRKDFNNFLHCRS